MNPSSAQTLVKDETQVDYREEVFGLVTRSAAPGVVIRGQYTTYYGGVRPPVTLKERHRLVDIFYTLPLQVNR